MVVLKTQVNLIVCHLGYLYCPHYSKALKCFLSAGSNRLFFVQRKVGLMSPLGNAENISRCI